MTTAYPLSWPDGWERTPARARKASKFRTRYADAYDNLTRELGLLGASRIVVSTNVPLRRDGRPYTEGMEDEHTDPGVAVYFTLSDGPRVMARDGHPTPAENLHAIGHVISHLRGLERHGGAMMMRRAFAGFTALPAPGKRSWREVLGFPPGSLPTVHQVEASYRAKAKTAHPDAGGSQEAMTELNAARDAALKEVGQ